MASIVVAEDDIDLAQLLASVPLNSSEGHVVGTLCVMDETPGTCTEDTVQILHSQRVQALTLLSRAG